MATVPLYRPVGQNELDLIAASAWRRFPPRLDWQPIFYPVLSNEYATRIARDWNTRDAANGNVGYVTRFEIDADFIGRYEVHEAGGRECQEYWIPAEDLDAFNAALAAPIEVVAEYRAADRHDIQVVEKESGSARWKCSCGTSSGGRWSRSPQEALKAADRHRRKHTAQP